MDFEIRLFYNRVENHFDAMLIQILRTSRVKITSFISWRTIKQFYDRSAVLKVTDLEMWRRKLVVN